MAESTSLLANVHETSPHIDSGDDEQTPASHYFKRPIKVLTIVTLVLSITSIALLIAIYNVARHTPTSYTWFTERETKRLIPVLVASLVFSVINILVNFPILLNIIVDSALAASVIVKVVRFIDAFPDSNWCQIRYRYPNREPIYPDPRCGRFKLAATIMMGFVAGFSIIIAAIYLIQLLLRSIAIYRTNLWKRPLSYTLPTGEITLQVSLKVLRQEPAGRSVEGEAGSAHGPVYLS